MSRVLVSADVKSALAALAEQSHVATDTLGLPAIVQPLKPAGGGWRECPTDSVRDWPSLPYSIQRWYNRGHEVQALSAVECVNQEGKIDIDRLEYHVSLSGRKQLDADGFVFGPVYRISSSRARWALRIFGMDEALEDNHVPSGLVRNYWRPLNDREVGEVCKCVEEEPAMREMKGDFVWRGLPSK